jgi:hypothetical protein
MRGYILRDEEKEAEIKNKIAELTKEEGFQNKDFDNYLFLGMEYKKLMESINNKFMVMFIKGEFVLLSYNSTYFNYGYIKKEKNIAFDMVKDVYKNAKIVKEIALGNVVSGGRLKSSIRDNKEDRLNAINLKYSEINFIYSGVAQDYCIKSVVMFDRILLNDLNEEYLSKSIKKLKKLDFISDENKEILEKQMKELYKHNTKSDLSDWEVVRSTNEIIEQINKRK